MDNSYNQNNYNGLPVEPVVPPKPNSPAGSPTEIPPQYVNQMQPTTQQPMQPMMQQPINMKYCKFCAAQIPVDAVLCTSCGRQVEELKHQQPYQNTQPQQIVINNANTNINRNTATAYGGPSGKRIDKTTALILCIFLGWLGVHKFYEGKSGMGLVYLFTFGLGGIGWLIDILIILGKPNPYYV